MPEGLEKDISPQGFSDLLAFLETAARPRRVFPGNQPKLVRPAKDGSLSLLATNCEIYGAKLVFESKYQNLGNWSEKADRALWWAEIPEPNEYAVHLDWACANAEAGAVFVIASGDNQLRGTVEGTGAWRNYRTTEVGRLRLAGGRVQIVVRPAGGDMTFLMDLRGVRLVPVAKEP